MARLEAKHLASHAEVAHGFFGHAEGFPYGLNTSLDISNTGCEYQRRIANALESDAKLALLTQTHSPQVHLVGADWNTAIHPEGDGLVSATPGIALAILTADCCPVLCLDPQARVIGAAHAGWKGAYNGVLEATITAMVSLGAERSRIIAAIGPCISMANYEVGEEFYRHFLAKEAMSRRFFHNTRPEFYHFDLEGYVAAHLAALDLHNIETLKTCTYPVENGFFSYRRATHANTSACGRQISAILLTTSRAKRLQITT